MTLRNVVWTAGGNALMALTSFVASIFVIRNLGPSEYGILQEFIAVFTVIQSFENVINPNLFKRELLSQKQDQEELISAIGIFISGSGMILASVVGILILSGVFSESYWILFIMLTGFIFRITNGVSYYFDAHLKSLKSQISLNVGNGVSSAYKIYASYAGPSAFVQAFAYPLLYFVTAIVHCLQFRKEMKWKFPSSRVLVYVLRLARESTPVFLSTLVEMLKIRLPLLFLGIVALPADVGIYGAGIKLIEPWAFLASALSISFWPKLVTSLNESPGKHQSFVEIFFAVTFYVFLPLAVASLFFGKFLIRELLGPVYVRAIPVFMIHALILLVTTALQAINLVELSQKRGKIILLRNVLSLTMMVLTIYPFFRYSGISGVALSVLFSNLAAFAILPAFDQHSRILTWQFLKMTILGPKVILSELRKRRHP